MCYYMQDYNVIAYIHLKQNASFFCFVFFPGVQFSDLIFLEFLKVNLFYERVSIFEYKKQLWYFLFDLCESIQNPSCE